MAVDPAHAAAVTTIASRVRHFHNAHLPFRIYHGSTNSTRASTRRRDNTVDTSSLNRILHIDPASKTALVEPNVPLDALVFATLRPFGLVPPVVMEFPGITVGGGFSGTSGESSSFRHGTFDATVNWVEMVLADGTVARAWRTRPERRDLFWAAASGFGTLGVVTLLEVRLVEAKPFVRLTYSLCGVAEANAVMQRETEVTPTVDYLDAIVFSPDVTLVCSGELASTPPPDSKIQRFTRATDPWFYVHALRILKQLQAMHARSSPSPSKSPATPPPATNPTITEYIPLHDYLFRYDRGGFWTGRYAFTYFLMPFLFLTRLLLNIFMPARVMYRALHHSGLADTLYMVQDVGVPFDKTEEFTRWLDAEMGIYPLWLCPLRITRNEKRDGGGGGDSTSNADADADATATAHGLHASFGHLPATGPGSGLMNFGIWGIPRSTSVWSRWFTGRQAHAHFVQQNRALEAAVLALGGKKWLYGQAYYTESEFWAHYDRRSYEAVRAKYGASGLPSVWEKVRMRPGAEDDERGLVTWLVGVFWGIWPMRGLYGVAKTVLGREYVLKKGTGERGEGKEKES